MATLGELLGTTGAITGPYRTATGAASGDPFATAGGVLSTAKGAANLAELTGLATVPEVATAGLGGLAGLLGLGYGGYQLAEGNMMGIPSVVGGIGGVAGAAAPVAAAGTLGPGMAAAAPALAATSAVALPAAAILAIGLMNRERQEQARIENQTIESGKMRQGAQQGLGRLLGTQRLAGQMADQFESLPAAQQGLGLSRALEGYRSGLDGQHVVQQTIGNRGQGGAASLTKPLGDAEVARMSEQYYPALRDTQVGFTRAVDAAAQGAAPVPTWATEGFGTYDPAALLNSMSQGVAGNQESSFNPYWDMDYSQIVPGTYGTELPAALTANLPSAAAAPLTERFDAMPAFDLPSTAPLTDAQIADSAAARTAAAENIRDVNTAALADTTGNSPWGAGAAQSAMAYSAPYLEGGTEGLWRTLGISDEDIALGQQGMTDLPSALIRRDAARYAAPTPTG